MANYHEREFKDDPIKWAYEEYQRDPGYWLDRAKNGKGLIQEIAYFVIKKGKPQSERECSIFSGKKDNSLTNAFKENFRKS